VHVAALVGLASLINGTFDKYPLRTIGLVELAREIEQSSTFDKRSIDVVDAANVKKPEWQKFLRPRPSPSLSGRLNRFIRLNIRIRWKASVKVATIIFLVHWLAPEKTPAKRFMLLSIPAVFLLQTRPVLFLGRVLWHLIPSSPLLDGIASFLPAPQHQLLTLPALHE